MSWRVVNKNIKFFLKTGTLPRYVYVLKVAIANMVKSKYTWDNHLIDITYLVFTW